MLDDSHLGELNPQGTSETQDPVTSYAFNAQSEQAANRGKQWLNQCTWTPQLSYKSIQHKPRKGKCTAVAHNNIDNMLAPHTNVNYNVHLMPLLSMVMSITWVVDHLTSTAPTSVKVKWLVSVSLHLVEIKLPSCRLWMQLRWLKKSYIAIKSDVNAQDVLQFSKPVATCTFC